ncbi:MAG: TolC family protein [Ignavibacteriaceae bacterium]|nr:TolC family protein [Ignavibacteriaceae bacterium]
MKYLLIIITASFLLNFGNSTYAQTKMSLTVEEAIDIGLKNSKLLNSSFARLKSSEAKLKEVNASRLPSLKFSAGYTRLSEVDPFSISTPFGNFEISPSILNTYQTKLSLAQPLFTGFKLKSSSDIAEYSANASQEDYNKDRNELLFNIRNGYWGLFKAEQFKKVIDENVVQVKAHLNDAKNLLDQGMLTNNDVLKIEVQYNDALLRQIDANNNLKLAMINLNSIMGISLDTEIQIVSSMDKKTENFEDADVLVKKAYEKRAELKSANYRIQASESGVTLAQSSWYPQIFLFSNLYYNRPNSRIFPAKDQFDETWDAGVSLSWDVWNWLSTSHQTEQAEAALIQAQEGLGILKDAITLEVTQNFLTVNQNKMKIEISEVGVKQAEENMRITTERFRQGIATSSDVIDAEVALLQAKTNYTNSLVDYELAKAKLKKSLGE